jgi:hypothetical protein
MNYDNSSSKIEIRVPLQNETVKLKRKVALQIKNKYNLPFFPLVLDLESTTHMTTDAVRVVGKLTKENGNLCRCCNKTLKTSISMAASVGPVCGKYMGMTKYLTTIEESEMFKKELDKIAESFGSFEFWIPKTQIKEYVKGNRLKFLSEKFYK